MPNITKSLRRLSRGNAGNVTIEFGFVILFMVTLALGAYDFGKPKLPLPHKHLHPKTGKQCGSPAGRPRSKNPRPRDWSRTRYTG